MITQRSQYKFVTPPADVKIDGGILPARDVANNGSADELRGEDVCFLAEAGWRTYLLHHGYVANAGSPPTVPSVIAGEPLRTAAQNLAACPSYERSLVKYAIRGEPNIKGGYVKDAGASIFDIIPNILYNTVSLFLPETLPDTNGALGNADALRCAYYDLRKCGTHVLTTGFASKTSGQILDSWERYTYTGDSGNPFTKSGQGTSQVQNPGSVISISKYTSGWGGASDVYDWVIDGMVPSNGDTSTALAPAADGISLLVVFGVDITTNLAVGAHHDAIIRSGVLDNNGIAKLTALTAKGVRDAVSAAYGGMPLSFGDLENNKSLSISCSPMAILLHDSAIDTLAIDWNWNPAGAA